MIARIWHGYTTHDNADKYFDVLTTIVIPGIADKKIPGYHSIQVLRRELPDETEFITIMRFDSLDNIKAFTGEDYETAHVPAEARQVLKRFDSRSQHYEMVHVLSY
ncbi:MAG: antibiotic biosynthesis monooxygenase [Candidatus Zixiibacteriota bacterium]